MKEKEKRWQKQQIMKEMIIIKKIESENEMK
jgi:hypothetical protein